MPKFLRSAGFASGIIFDLRRDADSRHPPSKLPDGQIPKTSPNPHPERVKKGRGKRTIFNSLRKEAGAPPSSPQVINFGFHARGFCDAPPFSSISFNSISTLHFVLFCSFLLLAGFAFSPCVLFFRPIHPLFNDIVPSFLTLLRRVVFFVLLTDGAVRLGWYDGHVFFLWAHPRTIVCAVFLPLRSHSVFACLIGDGAGVRTSRPFERPLPTLLQGAPRLVFRVYVGFVDEFSGVLFLDHCTAACFAFHHFVRPGHYYLYVREAYRKLEPPEYTGQRNVFTCHTKERKRRPPFQFHPNPGFLPI